MSGLIWVQTVWRSDGIHEGSYFYFLLFFNLQATKMQNYTRRGKWRRAERTIILWDDCNTTLIWSFTRSSLQFYLHRLQWRFKGSASAWCIHHHQIRTSALRVSKVSKNLKICTWKILFVKANKPLIWQQLDWICPVRDTLNDNDFAYYEAISFKLVFHMP